jgi:hypothetical protein
LLAARQFVGLMVIGFGLVCLYGRPSRLLGSVAKGLKNLAFAKKTSRLVKKIDDAFNLGARTRHHTAICALIMQIADGAHGDLKPWRRCCVDKRGRYRKPYKVLRVVAGAVRIEDGT